MILKKIINRKEAGNLLGKALISYQSVNPVVLAIPRGGVEVGYYIARHLNCELSVIIARRLALSNHQESAFGAISEGDTLYLNPWIKSKLSKEEINKISDIENKELMRRVRIYRIGKPLPELVNRTVIISDDGIASGATMFAAIESCKKQHPANIVVAAPVAGRHTIERLLGKVDDVCILKTPDNFYSVLQTHEQFENLDDEGVIKFLYRHHISQGIKKNVSY